MSTFATHLMTILAQTLPSALPSTNSGQQQGSPFGGYMIPLTMVMLIFLFFSFTSKRKQDKERQNLLGSMKRGDRVQTIGGILGTIVEVRDNEIVVKVDESNNTKLKFTRSAISRVVTEEDKSEAKS